MIPAPCKLAVLTCYRCNGPLVIDDRQYGWCESCHFFIVRPGEERPDSDMVRRMVAQQEIAELERMYEPCGKDERCQP